MPSWGGILSKSNKAEAPGQSQDTLEGLYLLPGLRRHRYGLSGHAAATATQTQIKPMFIRWMEKNMKVS